MATILIVDCSRPKAAYLKMALTRDGHEVDCCAALNDEVSTASSGGLDLILVNLEPDSRTGWEIFFELKRRAPDIPVMLYVMDQMEASAVRWIVSAVDEAVGEAGALRPGGGDAALSAG